MAHPLILLFWLFWGCQGRPDPCGDAEACLAEGRAALERADAAAAVASWTRACSRYRSAAACRELGELWLAGKGPKGIDIQPFGEGIDRMGDACLLGDGAVCQRVAERHLRGVGLPKSDAEAAMWLARGCTAGHAESCVDQGLLTEAGRGTPRDAVQAKTLYLRGCELREGRGCVKLGLEMREQGDGLGGVARMEEGCRLGFMPGCGLAAMAWEKGEGVTPNPRRRAELLVAGAALGDGRAAEALASIGDVSEVLRSMDERLAERCDGGDGAACLTRGVLAELGGERDVARVAGLFQTACERGASAACGRWAELAEEGLAAAPPTGLMLAHERACEADRSLSCVWLGRAYESGELTEGPDLRRAREVWERACRLGRDEACVQAHRLDAPLP